MRTLVSSVRFAPSLCLAVLLAAVPALHADDFSYTITTGNTSSTPGTSFLASGTLTGTADPYTPGAFDVTGISGSAPTGYPPTYTFSSVYQASTDSLHTATADGFTFNNVLFTAPGSTYVDNNGFLLFLTSTLGTSLAHVYLGSSGYQVDVIDPNDPGDVTPFQIANFTVSPSPVPEPSSLALLGTGLLGATTVLRRRLKRS